MQTLMLSLFLLHLVLIQVCVSVACSSKDSFVKWWDLDTQHCFKTVVGHRSEVRTAGTG